jgi:DNA-binding XRE family transcriptional regulator
MEATASRLEATYPVHFKVDEFLSLAVKRGARLQRERADLLGVHRSTLHHWVNGDVIPELAVALKVAKTLGVKVEDIWQLGDKAAES